MFKILFLMLTCGNPVIDNRSPEAWGTKGDIQVLSRAKEVCNKMHKSCVKKIIKKSPTLYNVVCG